MQFDSQAWIVLILNLAFILAFSWVSFKLLQSGSASMPLPDTYLAVSQAASASPLHLRVKRYLVVRRMMKSENDDDPPHLSSWF